MELELRLWFEFWIDCDSSIEQLGYTPFNLIFQGTRSGIVWRGVHLGEVL